MEMERRSAYTDSSIVFNHVVFRDLNIHANESHTHDSMEMIYLINGDVSYVVEGRANAVSNGSLILTRPGNRHHIRFNTQEIYDRYDVQFDEKILPAEIAACIPDGIDVIKFDAELFVDELFRRMELYCNYFSDDMLKKVLTNLIHEVICNVYIASKNAKSGTFYEINNVDPLLQRAREYIERNLTENLSLEQICGELQITKSSLRNLFRRHMKINPKQYIISKRMAYAQRAIRDGERPTEIYPRCGFADYSSFYRCYKKYFGCAPSDEMGRAVPRTLR